MPPVAVDQRLPPRLDRSGNELVESGPDETLLNAPDQEPILPIACLHVGDLGRFEGGPVAENRFWIDEDFLEKVIPMVFEKILLVIQIFRSPFDPRKSRRFAKIPIPMVKGNHFIALGAPDQLLH